MVKSILYTLNLAILVMMTGMTLWSCAEDSRSSKHTENRATKKLVPSYADGFAVTYFDGYKIISLKDPWKDAAVSFQYVLTDSGVTYEEKDDYTTVIRKPIRSAVCFSTTYVSTFEALDATDLISGLANSQFVYSPEIQRLIDDGSIVDVGNDYELDYEKLVRLQPDVIFMYAMGSGFLDKLEKLESLGLKVVINAEYLEDSPLGQAEWMKFIAAFFDKEDAATRTFNQVRTSYESLQQSVRKETKPTVFCNLPWKGVWYVPGGKSFTAQLISDAGGEYLWATDDSRGSLNLDFEVVFEHAYNADIWINTGSETTLQGVIGADPKHREFKAFQTGKLYNHYRRVNEDGGNDYFESGTIRPDLILKDMILIFHPELLPEDSLTYYIKLS